MVKFKEQPINSSWRCIIKTATSARITWLSGPLVFLILSLAVVLLTGKGPILSHANSAQKAILLNIKGPIGPAVSDYVSRGIKKAEEDRAGVVILQMDTPGGFDHSMRDIIKNILSSSIPVVSYVAPGGSRAASAGTYILYASHVSAMAPTTNLGAATPIRVGGLPGMPEEPSPPPENEKPLTSDALERKMVNDAVAYIKALAGRHGRNKEWAEQAVREAVSLTAEEALNLGVIDLIADTHADLLHQLEGMEVVMETGKVTLTTRELIIELFDPDWRTKILTVITDPNIAYILMLLGIYGLIYELANPGFFLPGIVGAICLLLALYTFQILPINYAGLALILLGITFMIAEAFAPSFGALGIGGVIAFTVGSIILMDEEGMRISLPLIGGTALVSAGFSLWVMSRVYTMSRRKVITGAEEMIGITGEAMEDFANEGRVWVHGESWLAETSTPVIKGQKIQVTEKDGLHLKIKILQEDTA
ncbi:MAG: nodulation protein NfeD [Desulfobulbaceae bacterium]|uniref:Nodulation protein NfeD n=1 Tax=Candidatus Desulfobia pelagia TaxID=2841692 RepID=A0A8J6TCA9_9BACT|nr:nodulation protein NfeD [Candidatus Desulfobia pelagia]